MYNQIFWTSTVPKLLDESVVVQIYKEGKDSTEYSSYRPIALLNTTYKILAKMTQKRLKDLLDDKIVPYQFGYRKSRSASQAVFIARRAQEAAEREGSTLFQVALDYKKAFDCITHEVLVTTLKGYGVPAGLLGIVIAIYCQPLFQVKLRGTCSQVHKQGAGIRQGCPLSPYLFVLVTSRLLTTVLERYRRGRRKTLPVTLKFPILLYADDTFLMTNTGPEMNALLKCVVEESAKYNLSLNLSKCFLLVTNDNGFRVKFPSGEILERKATIKYLGTLFTRDLDVKYILQQRMRGAMAEMKKLKLFWREAEVKFPWRLVVFQAVVRTKLFYTLEVLTLTMTHLNMLDGFFYKCLRYTLGLKPTFVDRNWPNDRVLRHAKQILRSARGQAAADKLIPFSEYFKKQTVTLLGHVLRSPEEDLLRYSIVTPWHTDRLAELHKRVGRPRAQWLHTAANYAYQTQFGVAYTADDFRGLLDLAERREAPFG